MTKEIENQIKELSNIFFQCESYTSDDNNGAFRQSNLNRSIEILQNCSEKTIVNAYNDCMTRLINEVDNHIFRPIIFLIKRRSNDLESVLNDSIPLLHVYMDRVYEVRNYIINNNNKNQTLALKKRWLNHILGEFDDIEFIEDSFEQLLKSENIDDKFIKEFNEYFMKHYIKYSNNPVLNQSKKY